MSVAVSGHVSGRVDALTLDLALELEPGSVTALTGASGAGKTSLLRWIAGLLPLPGVLAVGGAAWQGERHSLPPHRRRLGLVFQGEGLLPHRSVRGNLAYAAKRAANPLSEEEIASMTGIAALLDRAPASLSGGEAQRAALARTLIARPPLLLLDEPLSALDPEARTELVGLLTRLFTTRSMTVLLVSHDTAEVSMLADQSIRLDAGRLTRTPEVVARPSLSRDE